MNVLRTLKNLLPPLLLIGIAFNLMGEVTVSSETTAFYSYGFADEEQMVPSTLPGVYDEKKNGYYIDGKISIEGSVQNKIDFFLGLSSKSMSGSPYLDLQLSPSTPSDFAVSLDSVYSRLYLGDLLFSDLEVAGADIQINMIAGKFGKDASDFAFSRFGMESVVSNLAMANSPVLDLETILVFPGTNQFYYGKKSNLSLNLAAGGLFGEDIQRLFDFDGGVSEHGKDVLGEYAPQFFADLALNRYVLSIGTLSTGVSYAYNGSGIYSGHSVGMSSLLSLEITQEKLFLPISLNLAFYEKNIDVMGSAADNSLLIDTTDFRNTIQVGLALGLQYIPQVFGISGPPKVGGDLTLSGKFTSVGHIYRDPLSVISLSLDGQYYLNPKIYVGGGFILGTIGDVTWKTGSSVSTSLDDYNHTFSMKDNFGYEAYVGLDFLGFGTLAVGFAHKKGLSMNYGIETVQSGFIKYRQDGTTLAEELWETKGIFARVTVEL